ncbi:MAG: glycosyltransferase [Treponema sp.]|jgi:glycosyltransferase involved in cell wall biosynthesis|nr:glycosyltransferase [Treponema sp.]
MTIAMFTDAYWPRINGVTVSIDTYSHALMRMGHKVVIVCPLYLNAADIKKISNNNGVKKPEPAIIQVPSLPTVISKEDRVAQFHKMLWVAKQLELFHPDIVHINSEFVVAEFGFYYAKRHNVPAVYTFHTLWEEYIGNYFPSFSVPPIKFILRRIFKLILKRSAAVIVPTTQIVEVVKKYRIKKEIYLLPTGIDPEYFTFNHLQIADFRGTMEMMYPLLKDKRILLFAGRVTKEKNIDFLLRILPGIVEKHPETVLLIVGDGPYLADLRDECERLNLTNHCVFTGYLERGDLGMVYAMSDIFVFPSLTETQGLVTIEAMYAGIPVVAIGSMGVIMVMSGNNGGFMVQNDEHEFTTRVFDLLEDAGLYQRKAEEAKDFAQNWIIDNMTVKLVEIYEKTMKASPPKLSFGEKIRWCVLKREKTG